MKKLTKMLLFLLAVVSMEIAVASPWPQGTVDLTEAVNGQVVSLNVLENDVGDGLFIRSVNESSLMWGRVFINPGKKSVSYTPRYGYEGYDQFWYVLEDEQGRTNASYVSIEVKNLPWSVAKNDSANAAYTGVISIPVLDNDEGTELRVVSVNEWSTNKGKVWLTENGVVKYQQVGEPRGEQIDEFWYVNEDKWGRKNAAKVVITLSESFSGEWPTANPDFAEAKNGLRAMIPVLDNDVGDGLALKGVDIGTEKGGRTEIVDKVIRYSPPKGFSGTDAFWYVFEDSLGRLNSARVEVEVSENTKLSVVEFCGSTYETDGTIENTTFSDRTPVPTVTRYLSLDGTDFVSGGEIDGRRYFREGTEEAGYSLWMEQDGETIKLIEPDIGQSLYFVGAYNKHVYFAQGRLLLAHDGSKTTNMGDLFESIVDSSNDDQEGVISSEARDNALYITALIGTTEIFDTQESRWRISDGLDLNLYNQGTLGRSFPETDNYFQMDISQLTYFNGFDYRFNYRHNDAEDFWYRNYTVDKADLDVLDEIVSGAAGEIIENNHRLFVKTAPFSTQRDGLNVVSGKLYVIDDYNEESSFVELATCEIENMSL